MTASEAIETLNWTTPSDPGVMVTRARVFLANATKKAPLRYKVAARVIIREFGGGRA